MSVETRPDAAHDAAVLRRACLRAGLAAFVGGCATPSRRAGESARPPDGPLADAGALTQLPPPPGLEGVPDVVVRSHDGRSHRFRSGLLAGRLVVFHFFYTRCTGSCPGTLATLLKLRQTVAAEALATVWFYSISLDPGRDDVGSLAEYARDLDLDGGGDAVRRNTPWLLLTAAEADTTALRRGLGYRDLDPAVDADRSRHAAQFTVGDAAAGRWSTFPAAAPSSRLAAGTLRIVGATPAARYARYAS